MMENTVHPAAGDKSCGCYICGGGKDEILTGKLVSGINVALCSKHANATTLPPKGQPV